MKACGLIVEYNPFHNGHLYHIEQARRCSGASVLIAVMSGNFLQRGEPAIIDKWTRAQMALMHGVDLVVELPFAYAVQSADYFAQGAIKLLHALACDSLCFGTDTTQAVDYAAFGAFFVTHEQALTQAYQKQRAFQKSYPQQMTEIYQQFYPQMPLDTTMPNHILAMSYAKENARYQQPMRLYPIQRKEAAYHDPLPGQMIASASAIRQQLFKQTPIADLLVPDKVQQQLQKQPFVAWQNYWPFLRYQILTASLTQLRTIYQMTEGLEYRLKETIQQANSFAEFLALLKTKRYTQTRLQRLLVYVLHQVTEQAILDVWAQSYLRVLGFSQTGRRYLHQRKAQFSLPLVTKLTQKQPLQLDVTSGQVYALANSRIANQDQGRFPIIQNQ